MTEERASRKIIRLITAASVLHWALVACTPPDSPSLPRPPTPPPDNGIGQAFVINSPDADATISGTVFFSVQALRPAEVESVTFRAGDEVLETISGNSGPFRTFLNAREYDAGPLDLSATLTDTRGLTSTRSITVNVEPDPPSSTTVGPDGATIGTVEANGGLSTLGIRSGDALGANVSFTARTQQEVLDMTGVDYDALGVTFLGAQEIDSDRPINQPMMVSSGGFAPMVQPGQAVVNYMIADGELVVVNTATAAPTGDVVADPVPEILIGAMETSSQRGARSWPSSSGVIDGMPGTLIELMGIGFNEHSLYGNVAMFHSGVDGQYFEVPGVVHLDSESSAQTFSTAVPPLAAGPATLTLINRSTGRSSEPFTVNIAPSQTLREPASVLIDEFFARAEDYVGYAASLDVDFGVYQPVFQRYLGRAAANLVEARERFRELADDPSPEAAHAVSLLAQLIQDSSVMSDLDMLQIAQEDRFEPAERIRRVFATLQLITYTAGRALAIAAVVKLAPAWPAVLLLALATQFGLIDKLLGFAVGLGRHGDCRAGRGGASSASTFTGMGSAPPPGGAGCGSPTAVGAGSDDALGPSVSPTSDLPLGVHTSTLLPDDIAGRVAVRVFVSGQPLPFSGLTDAGGYFFIPLIPESEPFTAVATDRVTGEVRTFDGIGPAVGDSVYIFFDFSEEEVDTNIARWDGGGDGVSWHDPRNWVGDTLPGPAARVVIDVPEDATVVHSTGMTAVVSLESTSALELSGGTLVVDAAALIDNDFTVSGGEHMSAAETIINGVFTWSGGVLSGPGRTTVNGDMVIRGDSQKDLRGRTIDNAGTTVWAESGRIRGGDGAVINNLEGATFDVQSDAFFYGTHFGDEDEWVTFNNAGTVTKSAGSDASEWRVVFNNLGGAIEVQTGTLRLSGGGSSTDGVVSVADGAVLEYGGGALTGAPSRTHILSGNHIGAGDGSVEFSAGTLELHEDGVTLNFTGGGFRWTGGTIAGAGTLANEGVLHIAGSGSRAMVLQGATVDNGGTVMWSEPQRLEGRGGAVFNNLAGAAFEIRSDAHFYNPGGEDEWVTFNNAGVLTKAAGTGTSRWGAVLNNQGGVIEIQTGTLRLDRGGSSTGGVFEVAAGATLDFNAGTHVLAGDYSGAGEGEVRFTGHTLVVAETGATLDFGAGSLLWAGGTIRGPGTVHNAGDIVMDTGNLLHLRDVVVDNAGSIVWSGSSNVRAGDGAALNNRAGASFDVRTDANFVGNYYGDGSAITTVRNAGLLVKTAGEGTSVWTVCFIDDSGTVEEQSGAIVLDGEDRCP